MSLNKKIAILVFIFLGAISLFFLGNFWVKSNIITSDYESSLGVKHDMHETNEPISKKPAKTISNHSGALASNNESPHRRDIASHAKGRPGSLADVKITPEIESALENFGPDAYEALDYRLGLLERLEDCISGKIESKGEVLVILFFDANIDEKTGLGNGFDLRDSDLPERELELFLNCLSQSHDGFQRKLESWPGDTNDKVYVGTTITLPLKDDIAYKIIKYDDENLSD